MLALFALGVTPKIALHALLAHHTDIHLRLDHGADQYNQTSFHCDTENLVVNQSFLDFSLSIQLGVPPGYPEHLTAALSAPLASTHPLFGLRGPPASLSI